MVWEPPHRLAHSFSLSQDPRHPTQVEIELVPDGKGCIMQFAHTGWTKANVEGRRKFGDWPVMLDRFAALAGSEG